MKTPEVYHRVSRERRGTAITEALLIMIPLVLFAGLAPFVAGMFLDMQKARTEAHRDMFDKTHTFLILPDSVMKRSLQGLIDSQFPGGELTEESRLHRFAEVPSIPEEITSFSERGVSIGAPAFDAIPLGDGNQLQLFDGGFPNSAVEGWEFIERRGLRRQSEPIQLLSYATTLRSPWTRLGYPWVTSQDFLFEPLLLQKWGETLPIEDITSPGGIWFRMRLAGHKPAEPGPDSAQQTPGNTTDPVQPEPLDPDNPPDPPDPSNVPDTDPPAGFEPPPLINTKGQGGALSGVDDSQ